MNLSKLLEISKNGPISVSEATQALEISSKLVLESPTIASNWILLSEIACIKELFGRRLLNVVEKNVTEGLTQVLQTEDSELLTACEQAWTNLSDYLGFNPRLEALGQMISTCKLPFLFLYKEFSRIMEGEVSRKRFEVVCQEGCLLSLLKNRRTDILRLICEEIIYACIFESDEDDEILNACKGIRMDVEPARKKKRNQNNWRNEFWIVIEKVCVNNTQELPLDSLSFLCSLHSKKHSGNSIIWFELLFLLLGKNDLLCNELLLAGTQYYVPTSSDDTVTFTKWVERMIDSTLTMNLSTYVSSALTLDHRSVSPHFERLLKIATEKEIDIPLIYFILKSFVETRRISKFIELILPLEFENLEFSAVFQFRNLTRELLRTKLTEHQQAIQVWKSFLGINPQSLVLSNKIVFCLFESFANIVSFKPDDELKETVKFVEEVTEKFSLDKLSFSSNNLVNAYLSIRFFHTFSLLRKICDVPQQQDNDMEKQHVLEKMKKIFVKAEELFEIRKEIFLTIFDCYGNLANDWLIDNLLENVSNKISRQLLEQIEDVHLCVKIWNRIVFEKKEEFQQILKLAWFYEIESIRNGFLNFFEPSPLLLNLVSEFPTGYLTEKQIKKIMKKTMKAYNGEQILTDSILTFLTRKVVTVSPQIVKKAFKTVESFVDFLNRLKEENNGVETKLLIENFVCVTNDMEGLEVLHTLPIKRNHVSCVFTGLAKRLKQDNNPVVSQICKKLVDDLITKNEENDLELLGSVLFLESIYNKKQHHSTTGSLPIGKWIAQAGKNPSSSIYFIQVCCDLYQKFEPSLDNLTMTSLISLSMFINAEYDKPDPFKSYLLKADPYFIRMILDSLISDCWNISSAETRKFAEKNLKMIFENGFHRHHNFEKVFLRQYRSLIGALLNILSNEKEEGETAWNSLTQILIDDRLKEEITDRDLIVILTATVKNNHVNKIRFLTTICESNPKIVCNNASSAFARSISWYQKHLFNQIKLGNEDITILILDLARLCESLKKMENSFRHHVTSLLADHVTLCYFTPQFQHLKRPLELVAFFLLDLCGEHELQQLHAGLGGGVGGARREFFRKLHEEYQKKHVFKGKI